MANLLFIVSVAPVKPYPELFASGPESTWAKKSYPEAQIRLFSGEPPSKLVKQLSDLRDMLRYPEAQIGYLGTVDYTGLLLRVHGRIAHASQRPRSKGIFENFLAFIARKFLRITAQGVTTWERKITSFARNRKRFKVTFDGTSYVVKHPSTLSGSLGIQLSVMAYLLEHEDFDGVFFTTSSAYVDVDRAVSWAKSQSDSIIFAGGNALLEINPATPFFLSGFFQYFTRQALEVLLNAKDLDHSLMNDEALSQWLKKHKHSSKKLGIVWTSKMLELGICPLCEDSSKIVVRCTEHGSRYKERVSMKQLDHTHISLDTN